MSELKRLILLSLAFVIGLTALVTACLVDNNWLILCIAIFYVLSPVPFLVPNCFCDDKLDPSSVARDWIYFLTTGLVISSFALPIVMYRIGFITGLAMNLVFVSDIIVLLSILGIFVYLIPDFNSII